MSPMRRVESIKARSAASLTAVAGYFRRVEMGRWPLRVVHPVGMSFNHGGSISAGGALISHAERCQ